MTAKILAAKPMVEQIKKSLTKRCDELKKHGTTPSMSVVLVGNNPASLSYIKNKQKLSEEVGAMFSLLQLPDTISEQEFLGHLKRLNEDSVTNGIIVQLPVPDHLRKLDLQNLVIPSKDIDGFHNENTRSLYSGTTNLKQLLPCTPKGIINLLNFYQVEIAGKHVVVAGRSLIVGKPVSMLLTNFNATVTVVHSQTKNIESFTKQADIVIAAIGKAHFFGPQHFDKNRKTIVIDVGTNVLNGKLVGDVDREAVLDQVAGISPVPGGVGPTTVLSLVENLIIATESQLRGKK